MFQTREPMRRPLQDYKPPQLFRQNRRNQFWFKTEYQPIVRQTSLHRLMGQSPRERSIPVKGSFDIQIVQIALAVS